MFSTRGGVAALAVAIFMAVGLPARAGSLPPRAEIGLTSGIDVAAFRQLVSRRYHVDFRIVVAADIDHDGDLDVLASTDHSFTVWVNDGSGHLSAHRLPRGSAIESHAPEGSLSSRGERAEPTIQGDGPSAPAPAACAHAPPLHGIGTARLGQATRLLYFHERLASPRAPPA